MIRAALASSTGRMVPHQADDEHLTCLWSVFGSVFLLVRQFNLTFVSRETTMRRNTFLTKCSSSSSFFFLLFLGYASFLFHCFPFENPPLNAWRLLDFNVCIEIRWQSRIRLARPNTGAARMPIAATCTTKFIFLACFFFPVWAFSWFFVSAVKWLHVFTWN